MATAYLIPNGNGNYTDFTLFGCTNAWECIADPPGSPNDLTTYLQETVAGSRQSVTLGDLSQGTAAINSITVTTRCNKPAGSDATIKNFLRVAGVDYDGAGQTIPQSTTVWYDRTETWLTNPATSAPWTIADVQNLEAGLIVTVMGSSALRLTQLYVTVDYTPSPHIASPMTFYLIAEKPPNALTALVNGSPTDPYMSISYDTGSAGSITPLPGMSVWFGSTSGGQERGVLRLRSWNGSNQISVAESDDVGPLIQDNDFITIKTQWRLWPKYPRALIQGTQALVLEDYDQSFTDQTLRWLPVAVAGPPSVTEYNGSTFQARFVGDRSFAVASGATISSYLWTAPGSVEGTSTSQGTEASPVTFTWTTTGQKLVYLRVTDSNGKQHTNYTWAFGVDPNNPTTVAYTDFDAYNDNFDFEQGGGSCTFTVHGSATIADFPNEAMIVMASRPTTPGQATPTGYWPNRDNVHFVGYILGNTVRQNPVSGDVTFQAATIDALMKNLTMFPVSLTYNAAPQNWTQAADLSPDRAAAFLWHYHSTLSLMTPIVRSGYGALIYRQDFGPGDLYSQLDSELLKTMWGKVVSNHQGVLHHLIDYNLMINSERSAVTVRKVLHKGVWVDDLNIEERHAYSNPVSVIKASGIIYTGGSIEDVCPSFSEAPGNAPKVYGRELPYDRLILDTQANLNTRTGRALAKHTAKYSQFGMRFVNDGSFTIAPQELFTSNVEAADNNRGLALTTRLLPRRIARTFDNQNMLISYDVGFEPETDGPAGITVNLPCGPPAQVWPAGLPTTNIEAAALVAGAATFGVIWDTDDGGGDTGNIRFGEVGSIDYGTTYEFESVAVDYVSFCGLTDGLALLVYRVASAADITAKVLTVSGREVTGAGSALTLVTATRDRCSVIKLSATAALAVWATGSDIYGMAMTISGTTITPGAETLIGTGRASGARPHIVALSATRAMVAFSDAGLIQAAILNISGTTITPVAQADASVDFGTAYTDIAALDSETAIVFYVSATDSSLRASLLHSINASTFTIGDDISVDGAVTPANDDLETPHWSAPLDSTHAFAAYAEDAFGPLQVKGVAVLRTGVALSAGTPVVLATDATWQRRTPSVSFLTSSQVVVAYYNQIDASNFQGVARTCNISGTTVTDNGDDANFSSDISVALGVHNMGTGSMIS